MNRRAGFGYAAALTVAWSLAAESAGWRVVTPDMEALPLPALARVVTSEPSGETWRQTGELGGSVAAARGEFARALVEAGWRLDKTIALNASPARSELMIWTRKSRRVLFMVWEKEAGTCGFAWGVER